MLAANTDNDFLLRRKETLQPQKASFLMFPLGITATAFRSLK